MAIYSSSEIVGKQEQVSVATVPDIKKYTSFQYPNTGYEDILRHFPDGKIPIFCYGSLMNRDSLGGTQNRLGKAPVKEEAIDTLRTVIAYDIKRIFNYDEGNVYHATHDPKEKAACNLERSSGSMVNGIAIDIDIVDLKNLIDRERGYDLVPIVIGSFQTPAHPRTIAYTFMSPSDEPRGGTYYTKKGIYPVRGYLQKIEDALKASQDFDDRFRTMWQETTFLSDGTTLVSQWDRKTFA